MWSIATIAAILLALNSIDAAPQMNNYHYGQHNPSLEIGSIMDRKPTRNFGVLQLGGGYGIAKRLAPLSNNHKYGPKTEKYRRGPLNGLMPGGAFGRAARSNCLSLECQVFTYGKFIKILKAPLIEEKPHLPFEVVSKNIDGRLKYGLRKIPTHVYKPNQFN